jgi:hypothetical protein
MGRIYFLLIFCSLDWLWPVFVFFVKTGVAALEPDFFAGNPHVFYVGADVEYVAVHRDEGGFFFGG